MSLKIKTFLLIIGSWALFLTLLTFETIYLSPLVVLSLGIIFAFSSCVIVNQLLTKRNLQLLTNKKIKENYNHEKNILSNIARHDQLTSLPNSVFFNEMLNKSISHAKRHKKKCGLLLVSIDNYDQIKNEFGEPFLQHILKSISLRFSSVLRSEDILAKLYHDQFIVLLNEINKPKFASTVAVKLLGICETPFEIFDKKISIEVSIGICIYPIDGASLEELVLHLEDSLYHAKNSEENNYKFFTKKLDIEAREFIKLNQELRDAVKNHEFVLYYQPKWHLKSGRIAGLEALLRWKHPKFGTMNPSEFISVAEDIGLINKIGAWAIEEACLKNKYWQMEGYAHFPVSINISSKQFWDTSLINEVNKIITRTDLNPKYLELEIDESSITQNIGDAADIMKQLKLIGIQLSIDHFGTGSTSVNHLKKLPINQFKIDKNFIRGLPHVPNDAAITNSLITLAHNIGLLAAAEGVETLEQVQYLSSQNCDIVQGYFLSYPMPADKIVNQFKKLSEEALVV